MAKRSSATGIAGLSVDWFKPGLVTMLSPKYACLLVSSLLCFGCETRESPTQSQFTVDNFLRGKDEVGFKKARSPKAFEFPLDHGAHPGFKNEWWYITGNLGDSGGRRFGFQFTLFRNALSPEPIDSASRWTTNQIYLAHVALTDVQQKKYYNDERFSRGAMDLAGVSLAPFKAWLEDWRLTAEGEGDCATCMRLHLTLSTDEFSLDLALSNTKPVVFHGDSGLSRKGETPGNASYYYSYTRLESHGRIKVNDVVYDVNGQSWLDHEWSTSSLQDDQVGWDWFSIQLSDQTELMLFQLRHERDSTKNFLYGTYVAPDGLTTQLGRSGFTIDSTQNWTSPVTGVVYPAGWRLSIPKEGLELMLTPLLHAQEQNTSFTYWEGAVSVQGAKYDQPMQGHGYVELTGYD